MRQSSQEQPIFSRGTKLSEVPPDFRGISVAEWQERTRTANFEAAALLPRMNPEDAPLSKKRIWSPMDDYGMKSA